MAPRFADGRFHAGYWGGSRGYYRDDHRRDFRERGWRERAWREHEYRERDRDFDRGRRYYDRRGGDFGRGFRR